MHRGCPSARCIRIVLTQRTQEVSKRPTAKLNVTYSVTVNMIPLSAWQTSFLHSCIHRLFVNQTLFVRDTAYNLSIKNLQDSAKTASQKSYTELCAQSRRFRIDFQLLSQCTARKFGKKLCTLPCEILALLCMAVYCHFCAELYWSLWWSAKFLTWSLQFFVSPSSQKNNRT